MAQETKFKLMPGTRIGKIGTEVRFVAEEGEKGPQASTVQITDKPGCNVPVEE